MDAATAWDHLAHAISEMQRPGGVHGLKLETVMAGVEILFEFSAREILDQVQRSSLPIRAVVSWLVFEGGRLPNVDKTAVLNLRLAYESTCPPGQGIIPPPTAAPAGQGPLSH